MKMKLQFVFCGFIILALVSPALGYNIPVMRKRQVDMRSFSVYDFPEDYYMSPPQEAQRQYNVNPKPNYITAFYPIYDFGRR